MDYSTLSDFDINKAAAIANGLQVQEIDDSKATGMTSKYHELRPHTVWVSDGVEPWEQYAPTLCWTDAGPILTSNKISIMWMTEEKQWCAWANGELEEGCWEWKYCPDDYSHGDNPLRAAMIVFLMMQESANVQDNPA